VHVDEKRFFIMPDQLKLYLTKREVEENKQMHFPQESHIMKAMFLAATSHDGQVKPNPTQHRCNHCGSVFKNDGALGQHFAWNRMCLMEGQMDRQHPTTPDTQEKQKRRKY
jgi:hypothetical protein